MTLKRKTISIGSLLATVNHRNQTGKHTPDERKGWNSLLEAALHESGTYDGFGFLTPEQVPSGEAPGILKDAGSPYPLQVGHDNKALFKECDETRRLYYVAMLHRTSYNLRKQELKKQQG